MDRPVDASLSCPADISGSDASFSGDGAYRWWLRRRWQPGPRRLLFIGLNPSAADQRRDDPTLRRLVGFARSWGTSWWCSIFLLAFPKPRPCSCAEDPVGRDNDALLSWWAARWSDDEAIDLWCGWGALGGRLHRDVTLSASARSDPTSGAVSRAEGAVLHRFDPSGSTPSSALRLPVVASSTVSLGSGRKDPASCGDAFGLQLSLMPRTPRRRGASPSRWRADRTGALPEVGNLPGVVSRHRERQGRRFRECAHQRSRIFGGATGSGDRCARRTTVFLCR